MLIKRKTSLGKVKLNSIVMIRGEFIVSADMRPSRCNIVRSFWRSLIHERGIYFALIFCPSLFFAFTRWVSSFFFPSPASLGKFSGCRLLGIVWSASPQPGMTDSTCSSDGNTICLQCLGTLHQWLLYSQFFSTYAFCNQACISSQKSRLETSPRRFFALYRRFWV